MPSAPLALAVGAVALGAVWLLAWRGRPQRVFFRALIALLIGYAFFGRGLAHVGVPPLYVGEVVLGLGVLATILTVRTFPGGPVRLSILAFMAWGAIQTIPYMPRDGVNAFRDAVTWGYALFALIVSVSITAPALRSDPDAVSEGGPALLPVGAGGAFLQPAADRGQAHSISAPKPGDMGVFLAGIAAFALLGLYSCQPEATRAGSAHVARSGFRPRRW